MDVAAALDQAAVRNLQNAENCIQVEGNGTFSVNTFSGNSKLHKQNVRCEMRIRVLKNTLNWTVFPDLLNLDLPFKSISIIWQIRHQPISNNLQMI